MEQYAETFCDYDPTSKDVHLPTMMTKRDFYEIFFLDLTHNHGYSKHSIEVPLPSTFRETWKSKFPYLKLPQNCRLGSCSRCTNLKIKKPTFAGIYIVRFI